MISYSSPCSCRIGSWLPVIFLPITSFPDDAAQTASDSLSGSYPSYRIRPVRCHGKTIRPFYPETNSESKFTDEQIHNIRKWLIEHLQLEKQSEHQERRFIRFDLQATRVTTRYLT
jgi:hypothetical protein